MNTVLDLFLTFAKIGFFTFGGGYAMISLIEDSCVEKKQWITHDEMLNVTVIAESTPGPIAINCATFVGYKQKGLTGAVVATIGIVLPFGGRINEILPDGVALRMLVFSLKDWLDYIRMLCGVLFYNFGCSIG